MSLENRHKLTSNYHGSNQNKFFVSTLFLIFMERSISIVFCNLKWISAENICNFLTEKQNLLEAKRQGLQDGLLTNTVEKRTHTHRRKAYLLKQT